MTKQIVDWEDNILGKKPKEHFIFWMHAKKKRRQEPNQSLILAADFIMRCQMNKLSRLEGEVRDTANQHKEGKCRS